MYASPPAVNARTPPTRSTTMPVQEGRRDLDEGRRPDDQPDLRIGDAGLRERDRQRCGERMEAGLDGEDGEGETEHPRIIAERSAEKGRRPRRSGPVGGSAGRRGRLAPGGRDGP